MIYWRWSQRRRHPLLSLLLGIVGVVVLLGILTLGFFALLAFAVIGGIVALIRAFTRSHLTSNTAAHANHAPDSRVIEGEYVVVRHDTPSLRH